MSKNKDDLSLDFYDIKDALEKVVLTNLQAFKLIEIISQKKVASNTTNKISNAEKIEIINMLKANISIDKIMQKTNRSRQTIHDIKKSLGLTKGRDLLSDKDMVVIYELYKNKVKKVDEIAKLMNCSDATIRRAINSRKEQLNNRS